jgi:hypothetical protein
VPVLVPRLSEAEISVYLGPELARIAAAWHELPAAIRSAILALVDSAKPSGDANG